MTSLTKIVLGGLGVAIATSIHLPASANPTPPSQTPPEGAAALGGPLSPSNATIFQAQQEAETDQPALKVDSKTQTTQVSTSPLSWESEHLDDQRRSDTRFSFINVDLN